MLKNKVASLLVVGAGLSLGAGAVRADKKATSVLMVPAADLKWSAVPNMTGIQIAPVDGDPSKGPSHFFIKFDAGFTAPVHHHTANHSVTVVAGTLVLTVDGKEQKLPPGSFFTFTNKAKHATACEKGADCILSMDVRGKWDVVPEADKGAKK